MAVSGTHSLSMAVIAVWSTMPCDDDDDEDEDDDNDDEYTNLYLCDLCFLLFLFIYSSLSISFSFLPYLTIHYHPPPHRTWDIERDDVEHPSLELVSMKGGYMASTVQCSATGDIVVAGDSAGNVTFWSGQGSVGTAQTSQAPLPTGTSRLKRNNKGKLSERIMRKIASAPITSYPVGNVSCYGEASVSSMHMHPSGEYMIVAYTDRTINVYDCPAIYTPTVDNNTGGGRTVKRPSSAKVFQRRNSHVQNASSASLFARGKSGSTGSGGGTDIPESVMSLLLQIEAYNVKHGGGLKYIPFDPNSTIDSDDGEDGEEKGQKPKGVVSLGGNGSVTVNKLANKGDRVILIMDVE